MFLSGDRRIIIKKKSLVTVEICLGKVLGSYGYVQFGLIFVLFILINSRATNFLCFD